jgi:hypothetical protein
MTVALYDEEVVPEVVPMVRPPKLTVVPTANPAPGPSPTTVRCRCDNQPFGAGGNPMVDGAARVLSIPMRQLYAVLWRVGLLEVV